MRKSNECWMDMALSVERKILVVEMFPCSALVFLCCQGSRISRRKVAAGMAVQEG